MIFVILTLILIYAPNAQAGGQCVSNPSYEEFFKLVNGVNSLPKSGSCCMKDVCNLPCPETLQRPSSGEWSV
jgi:hypothetical protein